MNLNIVLYNALKTDNDKHRRTEHSLTLLLEIMHWARNLQIRLRLFPKFHCRILAISGPIVGTVYNKYPSSSRWLGNAGEDVIDENRFHNCVSPFSSSVNKTIALPIMKTRLDWTTQ